MENKIRIDDKDNLVGLSNSILKHFDVEQFHPGIETIDKLLQNKKKVVVFLFDGLGEYVIEQNKKASGWMLKNKVLSIYSVNPATTAAATTSFLSGKYPIETGWLGWSLYDEEEGFPIEILRSRNFVTGEDLTVKDKGKRDMPYKNIVELINEKGHNAKIISPFAGEYKGKLKISKIASICSDFMKNGGDFAYVYWPDPDATLHSYGVKNHHVQKVIRKCRRQVDKFSKKNKDVLVLVIADHGMVDVQYRDLAQYPDIDNCLDCTPFLDSRCPSFKLKPGKEEEFKKAFLKHFSFEATLYTKEEILSSSYFGIGEPNPKNADRLGDYVALIDGPDCFFSSTYPCNIRILKGHHAGMDERERRIIVAAFNK